MIRKHTMTIMHSYLVCTCKLTKKVDIVKKNTHNGDFQKRDLKKIKQLYATVKFTKFSKAIRPMGKKLDTALYNCFKNIKRKKNIKRTGWSYQ